MSILHLKLLLEYIMTQQKTMKSENSCATDVYKDRFALGGEGRSYV